MLELYVQLLIPRNSLPLKNLPHTTVDSKIFLHCEIYDTSTNRNMILPIVIIIPVDDTDEWLHYSTWNQCFITFTDKTHENVRENITDIESK